MTQNNPLGKSGIITTSLEVTVDVKPQDLKQIRPFAALLARTPVLLPPEAQMVLQTLFMCFNKQKSVSEGKVVDLVFGFSQKTADATQLPPALTLVGLKQLTEQGYVKLLADDNTNVSLDSEYIGNAWVRYQPKFLELVYEDTSSK